METVEFDGEQRPVAYLGDGVYAIFDGYGVWLHANDHKDPTDKIYLALEVLVGLNNFVTEALKFKK